MPSSRRTALTPNGTSFLFAFLFAGGRPGRTGGDTHCEELVKPNPNPLIFPFWFFDPFLVFRPTASVPHVALPSLSKLALLFRSASFPTHGLRTPCAPSSNSNQCRFCPAQPSKGFPGLHASGSRHRLTNTPLLNSHTRAAGLPSANRACLRNRSRNESRHPTFLESPHRNSFPNRCLVLGHGASSKRKAISRFLPSGAREHFGSTLVRRRPRHKSHRIVTSQLTRRDSKRGQQFQNVA